MGVFLTLLIVLLVTALILYYLRPKPYDPKLNGCYIGEAKPGETRVLRGCFGVEKLVDYNVQHNETIADVVDNMTKKPTNKLIGYRKLIKEVPYKTYNTTVNGKEVKKTLYKYQMSDYIYFSSEEFQSLVNAVSTAIANEGFVKGDKIALFCETRYEWMAFLLAACRQGIVIVTVYSTLSDDSVTISLQETEVKGLVVSAETIKRIGDVKLDKTVTVISVDDFEQKPTNVENKMVFFSELRKTEAQKTFTPVSPTDLAIIMYTSGTSKEPKGILVQQKQILMLGYGYHNNIFFDQDVLIAYLPLAHIFELCIEFAVMMHSGTVGYASPRTLIGSGVVDCQSDLCALEPTILLGVPTVFNRVQKAILDTVMHSPVLKKSIFFFSFGLKEKLYINYNYLSPYLFWPIIKVLDLVVFQNLKHSLFGKRLTSIVIGGSALPVTLQRFLKTVLPNTDVMQGFGMTEVCGAVSVMPHGDATTSTIGVLFPMYEAKLRDVPELNYFTNTVPPKGELMIRGLPVSKGYYKRPEEDKESFTQDGWLCTGDIALITDTNHICIIDRKKNIVKQPSGEYVSLEFIESKYVVHPIVDTICVFADNFHDFVVALVVLNKKETEEVTQKTIDAVIQDRSECDKIKHLIEKDVSKCGLNERQKVKHFKFIDDEWTPENGMLTAALKMKRSAIEKRYKTEIDTMFNLN
ncbi:long-chain-fatty-acid--CoA ligase, putative [Entamoeba invadens IP1]|uniref:Long-chain-fatty-acid--CoA ligase, putative n=1 Tax=Entamoeba invadens IP1 TaxID=370355 RepID=A0A0A1TVP5_ENTIV|nr:long-chain-fatty-acid--CoA ligase, putative [Entamoeba invadens IP1]ELP84559.1 long-chain-fatty-acid--CoA ligase, putative [Entamoeba invadens IP1]|eukprot:XP_004183905.1 long-chain-fatty-acid--CoA ligase, putative [Entamoeba invadens IP1]